jgi:hypothetical protein
MTNTKKRGRPAGSKNTSKPIAINWEVLAKNLQQALAKEIKENDELRKDNERFLTQAIKLIGIVEYLENKIGNSSV